MQYRLFSARRNRRYTHDPSLKEIAAIVHLSPIYFNCSFHQTYCMTPHTYQSRKRMHFAQDILRKSGTSVAERASMGKPAIESSTTESVPTMTPLDFAMKTVVTGNT